MSDAAFDPSRPNRPNRREALKKIALGTGAATALPILGQGAAARVKHPTAQSTAGASASPAADPNWKPAFFDEHHNQTVMALSDLIVPETDTPGAKAALVNRYLDLALHEEDAARQRLFLAGLGWLDAPGLKLFGKPFVEAAASEQTALLAPLADPDNKRPEDRRGVEFFQEFKALTVFAYYTSRIGMEQELEYGGDDYHAEFPGACAHPEHQT